MMNFDIFNGDADGICALIQLRLAFPLEAQLVTGVKRDIDLLSRVPAQAGDHLCVLDISLDVNRSALLNLLQNRVEIFYADHHFSGEIPAHPALTCLINDDANVCTSLLINSHIGKRFPEWAITGAFGDNLADSARQIAKQLPINEIQLKQLQQLGICINYNAYGMTLNDLHIAPDLLFQQLVGYHSPFNFIEEQGEVYQCLLAAYADDMSKAASMQPEFLTERIAVFILPDEKWARRVNGVWSNELANRHPHRAHAVLNHNNRGGYQVSVRAPLDLKSGADKLCRQFPEGGGRQAAAGINHLQKDRLAAFINAFCLQYQ
jgi:hypothetical protein